METYNHLEEEMNQGKSLKQREDANKILFWLLVTAGAICITLIVLTAAIAFFLF